MPTSKSTPMLPLILSPIAGFLIYFGLRRTRRRALIYCTGLIIAFIPTIPIFFTYSRYTSTFLRDTFITLFLSVAIASLIQRGLIQNIIVAFLLLLVLLLYVPNPPTFDLSEKVEIEKFEFDNYSVSLEKTKQHTVDDIYQWRAKKYYVGQILYSWIDVKDSSNINNKCTQTLYISRVESYEKGITTLERIVNYDTCKNNILSIERH